MARHLFGKNVSDHEDMEVGDLSHVKPSLKRSPKIVVHLKCSKETALHRFKEHHHDQAHEIEFERRFSEYE